MSMLKIKCAIAGGLLVLSGSAFAQAANTSTAEAGSFIDNLSIKLASDIFAGPVTNPLSSLKPNVDTGKLNVADPVHTENALIAMYKLDKISVGAAAAVLVTPFREKSSTLLDPQLRLVAPSVYSKGNFNLGTQVRVYLPASEASQARNAIANVRWYQMATYEIPNSRFSLELTTYLRPYFYSSAPAEASQFHFYAGPAINYTISPNLTAWGLFEYLGTSSNADGLLDLTPATDLEFGLSWNVSKRLSFTPFIDIKTSNRVALDTTTLNASISFTAL